MNISINVESTLEGCACGVMDKKLNHGIVVREFKL